MHIISFNFANRRISKNQMHANINHESSIIAIAQLAKSQNKNVTTFSELQPQNDFIKEAKDEFNNWMTRQFSILLGANQTD